MSGDSPNGNDAGPPAENAGPEAASLLDLLMRQARSDLDQIEEPSLADLAALDELEDFDDAETLDEVEAPPAEPLDLNPALALLADIDEPELVSLEGLDDAVPSAALDDESEEVDDLLDDVESLIEDFVDIDLDDEELEDEGYDLDDDEHSSYRDLYGDDDAIIPSFREGEFAEEDEADTAYYDDLR